jgi:membrane fusion protein (multidrug efflux system)
MSAVPTVNTKSEVVAERETEKRLASRGAEPRS